MRLTGCGGTRELRAANPSSVSGNAALFTIPHDQMAHVQVFTIEPTNLQRSLRLTGTVAYNNFHTTPVITPVSGPVSRIVVVPGQNVRKGEAMFYVASPDFSQLRSNYLKAKDADQLAQREYARAQDLYNTMRSRKKICWRQNPRKCKPGPTWPRPRRRLRSWASAIPDALVKAPPYVRSAGAGSD